MAAPQRDPRQTRSFRTRVAAAAAVLGFERAWPAFWPVLGIAGLFLALSLFGLWHRLPVWLHAVGLALFGAALVAAIVRWLVPSLRWPTRREALARIEADSGARNQPLQALEDDLPDELGDSSTRALWEAHRARLTSGLGRLKLAPPRSDLPRRDPWALRAALLMVLAIALVDAGGLWPQRLADAVTLTRPDTRPVQPLQTTLWVTPPAYTGLVPVGIPVSAPDAPAHQVPVGSEALVQVHHLPGDADTPPPILQAGASPTPFQLLGNGSAEGKVAMTESLRLSVLLPDGTEPAAWNLEVLPDKVPTVAFGSEPRATSRGVLRVTHDAADDYGIAELAVLISPADRPEEVERRVLAKPTGQVASLKGGSYLDLTSHPLAGLKVAMRLEAVDAIGQAGQSDSVEVLLPEREFTHPMARAVIEQRKALMRDPQQQDTVAGRLDALADTEMAQELGAPVELGLRSGSARLRNTEPAPDGNDGRRAVADLLWDLALYIEDGALSVAERDLRALQDELERALSEGAEDAEIERLMAELEQAMQRYLDELTRQAMENAQNADPQQMQPMPFDQNQMVDRQDLQQMLDRARELMRSGAREAAQDMLAQLREMLENLQTMTAQRQLSPEAQALSDLQKMIQLQRNLLERSFQMQRQQNGSPQPGEQGQQQGQQGQQGEGMPQDGMGQAAGEQDALRRALGELMRRLGESGMEIPRSLGQAELSMRGARDALQQQAPGSAAEAQGQALDQMQQGGQALVEQMQQQMGNGPGQAQGEPQPGQRRGRDPLGRSVQNDGGADTNGELVPEESDLGRARGVLEELYRRSGERGRPPLELDYYNRLLDRF
ncbi:MAG: TIGR02302 family protein [Geminicoccaceae bacterium]